jgi:RNA polymerase sigma factor (sigma-70 family)
MSHIKRNSHFPLLSLTQEREIGFRALKGDEDAMAELALGNLGLVIKSAKKFQNKGVPLDELIEAGNLGLMLAIKAFNPEKGRFSSLAIPYIEFEIRNMFSENYYSVKLSRSLTVLIKDIDKCASNGVTKDTDVSALLGVNTNKIREARSAPRKSCDINSAVEFHDADANSRLIQGIMSNEQKDIISSLLSQIPKEKDRKIIVMRYGLGENEPMSRHDVARHYSVTDEAIRQKEKKILERLNLDLKTQGLTLDILTSE